MIYLFILVTMAIHTPQDFLPYRQLLLFGNAGHAVQLEKQLSLLKSASADVEERDLKPVVVKQKDALYGKYSVRPDEFTIILIGKDGTEKYRSKHVITLKKLFAIIDGMPMRKSEMKQKK